MCDLSTDRVTLYGPARADQPSSSENFAATIRVATPRDAAAWDGRSDRSVPDEVRRPAPQRPVGRRSAAGPARGSSHSSRPRSSPGNTRGPARSALNWLPDRPPVARSTSMLVRLWSLSARMTARAGRPAARQGGQWSRLRSIQGRFRPSASSLTSEQCAHDLGRPSGPNRVATSSSVASVSSTTSCKQPGDDDVLLEPGPVQDHRHGRGVLEIGDVAPLAGLSGVTDRRPSQGPLQPRARSLSVRMVLRRPPARLRPPRSTRRRCCRTPRTTSARWVRNPMCPESSIDWNRAPAIDSARRPLAGRRHDHVARARPGPASAPRSARAGPRRRRTRAEPAGGP